jgi:DNA-binding LacI/PurR family transcriptional regulator
MPSAVARGLKTRRSFALGVIVSDLDDPFWGEVLQGIDDVLHPAGYSLFVAATHREPQREKEIVHAMVQRRVDGVILCAPQFSAEQSRLLKAYGLPTAVVNNMGAEDYQYSIYNDNIYGIKLVTRHLIELGHRQIAYIGNAIGGRTTIEREAGFREEMQAADLDVQEEWVILGPEGTPQGGFAAAQHLLSLKELPTAIVCYNDNMAIGVYSALFQAGLRVPQDLSVTGFDNIAIAAYLIPPLTTLQQPKYDLGFGAAEILLGLLPRDEHKKDQPPEPQSVALRGELVVRNSTQPPP